MIEKFESFRPEEELIDVEKLYKILEKFCEYAIKSLEREGWPQVGEVQVEAFKTLLRISKEGIMYPGIDYGIDPEDFNLLVHYFDEQTISGDKKSVSERAKVGIDELNKRLRHALYALYKKIKSIRWKEKFSY